MLLGITFSNLSTEQKNLKAQKKINHVCRVLEPGHSTNIDLCRVPRVDTRQRLNAVSHPNGRRTAGARAGHVRGLCRVRARRHSAKVSICRVPYFVDGQHSAKCGHAVCHIFAECPLAGTRQSWSLPSVCGLALGKARDTRQFWIFR